MRFVVSLLLGVCGFLLSGQAGFAQSIVGQDETFDNDNVQSAINGGVIDRVISGTAESERSDAGKSPLCRDSIIWVKADDRGDAIGW
jgi:hypothetical protein